MLMFIIIISFLSFRTGYIVKIPVPETIFHLMPHEIQEGHPIKVTGVMFTIGMNEQATFAERLIIMGIGY